MATPPNQDVLTGENATNTQIKEISADAEFSQAISAAQSETLLVIYFHAPWAAPCQQMSVVLQTLASTYPVDSPPKISFLSVNAEEFPDISEQYEVSAVPYIVLQKGGQTVETISGSDAAKVRDAVEKHAGTRTGAAKTSLPPAQAVTKPEQTVAPPQSNGTKHNDAQSASAEQTKEGKETSKEELFTRLQDLVKAAPVMLFMKGTPSSPQCGFSRQTVGLLRERGIRYGFFNILADDDVRQGLKEFADWPTYPQLWVGGELVGGLDIVKEEFSNDPDFLNEYSVNAQKTSGASTAPDAQAQPA